MKFSQYNPVVAPNTIQGTPVQAQNIPVEHPSGARANEAWAGALGQIAGMAQKMQDEKDSADVMQARNDIMTSLTQEMYGENGILTTGVGENAKGLTDRVTQTIQKTFDQVSGKYNRRVQAALKGNLNENMANYQRIAAQQEGREFVKQKDANYLSSMTMNADRLAASYYDIDSVNSILNDSFNLIQYRAADQGWSGEQIQVEKRKTLTGLLGGAINNAINDGHYDTARNLLDTYKGGMMQADVMKWEKALRGEENIQRNRTAGEDLYSMFGDDEVAARKYWEKLAGEYENVGGRAGNYSGNQQIDSLLSQAQAEYDLPAGLLPAMAMAESSFSQDAVSGAGALGIMQLMPDTAQALGVDPHDLGQNIKGGAKYLRQLLDEFGGDVRKAVAAYNAGPNAVKKYGDVPPYTETQNYVDKVLGAMPGYAKQAGGGWNVDGGSGQFVGQRMNNGEVGCVEFVTKAGGAGGNSFLQEELDKGVVNGDVLVADAKEKGLVQPFDASKLQKGDVIVYDDNDHVVIYDGQGGYYGNSTSQLQGVHGDDYTQMSGRVPTKIIKTGGSGGGHTRRKYSDADMDSIWKNYMARKNDSDRAKKAETQKQIDANIEQLNGMSDVEAESYMERLKNGINNSQDLYVYNSTLNAARTIHPGVFSAKSSGGGSKAGNSSGPYKRPYYYGESGERYTTSQIRNAQRVMEKWWKAADPSNPESVDEKLQEKANEASYILVDAGVVEGGADVEAQMEAYHKLEDTARAVWEETQDYDEAVRILVEKYNWTENNAIAILDNMPDKE